MREILKKTLRVLEVLLLLAAFGYGFPWFVDRLVENKLSEPETLRAIADQVRPTMIFEVTGAKWTLLADQGAFDYLEEIRVEPSPHENDHIPSRIVVVPKEPISPAPMLESLTEPGLIVDAEPGDGIEWRYTIDSRADFSAGTDHPRFRLEILRGTR